VSSGSVVACVAPSYPLGRDKVWPRASSVAHRMNGRPTPPSTLALLARRP
jgi:hypothetical protein